MPSRPARLLTFVDIAHDGSQAPDSSRMSLSARHEAVLADGRRVLLLDDRGWSSELRVAGGDGRGLSVEAPGAWAFETEAEIKRTARDVVGPDEPFEGRTQADMEASHWDHLAGTLRAQGIAAEPDELAALAHDVELSDRVSARLRDRS